MANPILANRYEVQRQLGQKTGRRTLLARDLQTGSLLVIKLLIVEGEIEWDEVKLFEREAATLQSLSHPAIPQYLDHFELDLRNGSRGYAMVQTYIEGRSLESYLQGQPAFSEAEVKQIGKAVLEILTYLHSRTPPIVHRDIKPSNILMTAGAGGTIGSIYLIDFGSVQNFVNRETSSFTVVGTYGYTPPEQLGGHATTISDLYSLGATLIALAAGTHPSSLPQKGMRIDVDQAVTMSPEFVNWLKWVTEPRIERRASSVVQALAALDPKASEPEVVVPTTSPTRFPVTPRKPPGSKISLSKGADTLEVLFSGRTTRARLRLDHQQISLATEVFGLKFNQTPPAPRQAIDKLELIKPSGQTSGDGNPQLIIWAGLQKFELGNDGSMTEPELDWLAFELSGWLDLPITEA